MSGQTRNPHRTGGPPSEPRPLRRDQQVALSPNAVTQIVRRMESQFVAALLDLQPADVRRAAMR
jgi:hypothetical protein